MAKDVAHAWMGLLKLHFGPEHSTPVTFDAAMLYGAFEECHDMMVELEEVLEEEVTARSARGDLRMPDADRPAADHPAVFLSHNGKLGMATAPPRFTDASLMGYSRAVLDNSVKDKLVAAFCTTYPANPSIVWVNAVVDTGLIIPHMAHVDDLTPLSESGA